MIGHRTSSSSLVSLRDVDNNESRLPGCPHGGDPDQSSKFARISCPVFAGAGPLLGQMVAVRGRTKGLSDRKQTQTN
jgi:hypothetical protein